MVESIAVFEPVAPRQREPQLRRQPLDSVRDRVIGFVDNAKPNFSLLVDDLAELLVKKHGVMRIIKRSKSCPSIPASDTVIQELVEQCDAVITGSGD